ncbi:MAG: hypothetical protein JO345_21860 [Streptosporangiaceae bacterium]|nr:hypothetical protein [Streptosporangiaceae bacterium]
MTKAEACRLLGVSERQVERRAKAGMIRRRTEPRRPDQFAAPVLFSRADIDAVKNGAPNFHAVVENAPEAAVASKQADQTAATARRDPSSELERILLGLGAARLIPLPGSKLWLTLEEAADYSGLPVRWLRTAAADASIVALNVGTSRRRRWLVSRDALASWRPS